MYLDRGDSAAHMNREENRNYIRKNGGSPWVRNENGLRINVQNHRMLT